MKKHIMRADSATPAAETSSQLFDNWFDPVESGVRSRVRDFIETMMEEEFDAVLSRPRYGRVDDAVWRRGEQGYGRVGAQRVRVKRGPMTGSGATRHLGDS
jgi:hypothetical protein